MPFFQTPPEMPHAYTSDRVLRGYLARALPDEMRRAIEPQLARAGAMASGPLYAQSIEGPRRAEARAVGRVGQARRSHRLTPLWHEAARIAAEEGLVATAYERKHGALSRVTSSPSSICSTRRPACTRARSR